MGIGYAALAIKVGLTPFQTHNVCSHLCWSWTNLIATMLAQGATLFAIVLTSFVLNLRYFVMNACIFNKVEDASPPRKDIVFTSCCR